MNQSRLNLTQLIRSPSTQILMNPSRNHLNLNPMSRSRTLWTRLLDSQSLPYKQTDKRMKGLRAPKETVNERTSSAHLLTWPALTPIGHGGKLACV